MVDPTLLIIFLVVGIGCGIPAAVWFGIEIGMQRERNNRDAAFTITTLRSKS